MSPQYRHLHLLPMGHFSKGRMIPIFKYQLKHINFDHLMSFKHKSTTEIRLIVKKRSASLKNGQLCVKDL